MKKLIIALLFATLGAPAIGQIKVSQLPASGALTGPELVPVVQSSVTKQTTAQAIANLADSTFLRNDSLLAERSGSNRLIGTTVGFDTVTRLDGYHAYWDSVTRKVKWEAPSAGSGVTFGDTTIPTGSGHRFWVDTTTGWLRWFNNTDSLKYTFHPYDTTYIAVGGGYDADAVTYFTAASISDAPTKDAVNDVVIGLKAISLTVGGTAWSKAKIVAPLAGPDIAAQKVNAKTPGTHNFVTNGGMSYDADGFVYDGVDDYADPSFTPITHFASTTSDFTIAHGQATAPVTLDKCAWGTTGDGSVYFYPKLTGGDVDYTGYSADLTFTPAATVGRYLMTWNDATTLRMYRNGTQVKTNTITPQATHSTYKIYFGANSSANTAAVFSDGRHSFYYVADARMTAAEAAAVDAVWAAYETAMGR